MPRSFLLSFALGCALSGCSGASAPATPDDDAASADDTATIDAAQDGSAVDASGDTGIVGEAGTTSPATLVVEPDDGEAAILSAISGAKKSVHLEVYLLSEAAAITALVDAKKAGREVKVLLEKSPYPATTANQSAYDQLKSAGVDVAWTTGLYTLTHSKTFVVDGATLFVTTLNFTSSGLSGNREYALRIDDPIDVAEAETVFAADFAGKADPPLVGALVVAPVNARSRIGALLDSAKSTLDLEMEELSDDGMVQRIDDALARGVKVRIVVPKSSRPAAMDTKLADIKSHGGQVRALGYPDVHAKCVLVDGARAYVGSENLTYSSLDKNREIGAITTTPAVLTRLASTIASDFAKGTAL